MILNQNTTLFFVLSISFTLLFGCTYSRSIKELNLNDKVPANIVRKSSDYILTSPSTYEKSISLKIDGINYIYGVNDKNIVIYISTNDKDFNTSEGFNTLSTFNQLQKTNDKNLKKEAGWAYYFPLDSGWNAAFTVGKTATENEPDKTDTVSFYFKRKKR